MHELVAPTVPRRRASAGGVKPVVIWNLTRTCNLKCRHCYTTSADVPFQGELSHDQAMGVLDDLSAFGIPALILSGGQPLSRFDFWALADKSDVTLTKAAIEAGMSGYVADGLRPERLKPNLDAVIVRFHMVHKMRVELAETRRALKERKVIDRARSILMRARGIDAEAAFSLLREAAMDQGKKVVDLVQVRVMATDLLK